MDSAEGWERQRRIKNEKNKKNRHMNKDRTFFENRGREEGGTQKEKKEDNPSRMKTSSFKPSNFFSCQDTHFFLQKESVCGHSQKCNLVFCICVFLTQKKYDFSASKTKE